jgi:FKBP-type peptidyl-prolyl cis-trans isomerase (trigger factor)
MKVVNKVKTDNKVILNVEVPKDAVLKKYDEVYEQIGKDAKVPGFRPGKAPRPVLEQHHSQLAREEVIKHLITESYESSVKEQGIDVIDLPKITDVKLDASVLTYKAEVEVKPEIALKPYKGLKIKKDEIKVEISEVEEYVKNLKKSRGDISDERLARSLGYKTAEEFSDCVSKQLYLKKENESRAKLEKELIDQVIKGTSFTAPQSLVDRRAHELEHEAEHQMTQYGLAHDRIKQRIDEFRPKFKVEAEQQVRVFLVLEAIAKKENIKSDDHTLNQVVELLFAEANWG